MITTAQTELATAQDMAYRWADLVSICAKKAAKSCRTRLCCAKHSCLRSLCSPLIGWFQDIACTSERKRALDGFVLLHSAFNSHFKNAVYKLCRVCTRYRQLPYLQHFAVAHNVARMQDFMSLYNQCKRAFQSISVEPAA